ncbi:10394_t:CDS:1 [Acaulospora colombiana]|uniref:10394_t:CDS:1 n=1 Tax=Acaulospora colombiana TaxID=27376 RepID=A0ACA9KWP7_9GLOM|nr:10394_t:CDS:1 [Acaulospora colombiana]
MESHEIGSDTFDSANASSPPPYFGSPAIAIQPVVTIHISDSHAYSPTDPNIPTTECLPPYSSIMKDLPPSYSVTNSIIDPFWIFEPLQPQERWSKPKSLYIYGYIFWPLWIAGSCYLFSSGLDNRYWAKRCLFNTVIFSLMFSYVIVIIIRLSR